MPEAWPRALKAGKEEVIKATEALPKAANRGCGAGRWEIRGRTEVTMKSTLTKNLPLKEGCPGVKASRRAVWKAPGGLLLRLPRSLLASTAPSRPCHQLHGGRQDRRRSAGPEWCRRRDQGLDRDPDRLYVQTIDGLPGIPWVEPSRLLDNQKERNTVLTIIKKGIALATLRPTCARTFCFLIALLTLLSVPSITSAAEEDSATELAKKTQNPVSDLISIPFESNFNFNTGAKDATVYVLNVQPIIPIHLSEDWNLIIRTIMPISNQPSLFPAQESAFGLGDINPSFFLARQSRSVAVGHRSYIYAADCDGFATGQRPLQHGANGCGAHHSRTVAGRCARR